MRKLDQVNLKLAGSLFVLVFLIASIAIIVSLTPQQRSTRPKAASNTIEVGTDFDGYVRSPTWDCFDSNTAIVSGRDESTLILYVYARFPLSALPGNATVTRVDLRTRVVSTTGSGANVAVGPFQGRGQSDPSAMSCASRSAGDSAYVNSTSILTTTGIKTLQLTAPVNTDIQNAKQAVNRFTIFFGVNLGATPVGSTSSLEAIENAGNDQMKLIITYTVPPTCSDECPSSGAKQCVGGSQYQTCGNYDADSCLEWSGATSCPAGQTCSGGNCVSSPPPKPKPPTPGPGPSPGPSGVLNSLQLALSVPYLIGEMKIPVKIGSLSKEIEVSPDKKNYSLDVKEANLALGGSLTIMVGGKNTLIKKIQITPTAESTAVNVGDLILGDLTGDNKIDDKDSLPLLDSIAKQTLKGDLNADKVTNSLDWAILLANFGKSGDF